MQAMWNGKETKHIDIETKQNNFSLAAAVLLSYMNPCTLADFLSNKPKKEETVISCSSNQEYLLSNKLNTATTSCHHFV